MATRCHALGLAYGTWIMVFAAGMIDRPAVAEIRDLPVPAVAISSNEIISGEHLATRRFRVTPASVAGFALDAGFLLGKQARRRLAAGKPIPLSAIGEPIAVRRGATVQARYSDAGLSITASVVALTDGFEGDEIQARNPASGSVVDAVVQADGSLLVSGQ